MIRKYTRLDCVVVFFVDARYMGDLLIELKNKRIIVGVLDRGPQPTSEFELRVPNFGW